MPASDRKGTDYQAAQEEELASLNPHIPKESFFTNSAQPKKSRTKSLLKKHRKKLIIGGTVASLVAVTGVLAFLFLAPLKLSFLSKNIEEVRHSRMDHIFTRRTDRFISSMLAAEIAGGGPDNNAYFQAKGYGGDFSIVQMYKNWRTNNAFQKLASSQGITFARSTDGDLLRINLRGLDVSFEDFIDKSTGRVKAAYLPELDKHVLNRFDTDPPARQALRTFTREGSHWWQILQRRHLRLWMGETLGVRRWTFFEGTRTKARQAVRGTWSKSVSKVFDGGGFLACLFDASSCPTSRSLNNGDTKSKLGVSDSKFDTSDATESHIDAEVESLDPKTIRRAEAGSASKRYSKVVAREIIKKFNIIMWVDLIDSVHKLIGKEQLSKMLSVTRQSEYALAFTNFQTVTGQIKEGVLSGEEANAALEMFDCVEYGDGYQQVIATQDKQPSALNVFEKVYAQGQPSGSDECAYAEIKNEHKVDSEGRLIDDIENVYDNTVGPVFGIISSIYSPVRKIIHPILEALGNLAGPFFEQVLSGLLGAFGVDYEEVVQSGGEWAMETLGGAPVCLGTETGGRLFNCVDGGAAVVQEQFLQSAGGRVLSNAEVTQLNESVADDKQIALASRSWKDRLFSTEDPTSLVGQLSMRMPAGATGVGNRLGSLASSFSPSRWLAAIGRNLSAIFSPFSQKAVAAADDNLYGLTRYGCSESELEKDPFEGMNDAQVQDEITNYKKFLNDSDDDKFATMSSCNLAVLDNIVSETLTSYFTTADDGGIGTGSGTDSSGGTIGVSGDCAELAKIILDDPDITYESQGPQTDISNCTADTQLLTVLAEIAEHTPSIKLRLSVIKTGHSTCSASGRTSNHWRGLAVDIGNEEVTDQLLPFLYQNRAQLKLDELIFDPMPSGTQTLDLGNPQSYDADTLAAHRNHIHLSVLGDKSTNAGCSGD